ncbi:hypothetical protein ACSU1N_00700 [Thermogladius sp. 4427co]|uniref:hypothetical protein n=1 Tax=Thermogladius sp. 4427co TaxID=3450718 RepID=UPI003F7B167D
MKEADLSEIYKLLANLKIDYNRLDMLKDISTEAGLYIRSKLLRTIELSFNDVVNITSLSMGRNIIVTATLEDYKFAVYIEKDTLVSSLMYNLKDPSKRESGLKPLAYLAALARDRPVKAFVYEVLQHIEEEKTSPLPPPARGVEEARELPRESLTHIQAEKINKFSRALERIVSDYANVSKCRVESFTVSISKGVLYVRVVVRKKGLLGKCDDARLKAFIERDIDLLIAEYEINMPVKIIVSQV